MPSKLKKALGAVKDQTSISLAKVTNTNASNVEVVILKATRHDEVPISERYVKEILNLISSNKAYAAACAQAIGKRIGKTRTWIVALKSLMLVLRIFQDGDPYFPREVLHAMKRGAKILNLSSFRDDSSSSPWDYTAFVRTFALYLDERLDCFVTGKLQRRFTRVRSVNDSVSDMKPAMLLDKISYWQKLLDRAIATRPTGAAKANNLVQFSLYAVVQESFDLYRDISDGLALLLDSFFHLPYQSCASAFQGCVKASKQFEELNSFYDLCKNIGVGRISEYPSVQKISEELMKTLQEFLKDQSSFPPNGKSPSRLLLPSPPQKDNPSSSTNRYDEYNQERYFSDRESEFGSQCTSLEDLMSATEVGTSPPLSMDHYLDQFEKCSHNDQDIISATDSTSTQYERGTISAVNSSMDLVSLEDWPPGEESGNEKAEQQQQDPPFDSSLRPTHQGHTNSWEMVLTVAATESNRPTNTINFLNQDAGFGLITASNAGHDYNPFLQDTIEIPAVPATNVGNQLALVPANNDTHSMAPMFQAATPTFSSQNPEEAVAMLNRDDPFAPYPVSGPVMSINVDQQSVLQEQQLWLMQQNKIIAKNLS